MFDAITLWKYGGVLAALLAAGFGAPIPEEIPVVTAGAMVGHDAQAVADYDTLSDAYEVAGAVGGGPIAYLAPQPPAHLTRWWLMLLVCIVGVVVGDTVIYTVGRVWGPRLLANGWVQRHVLPPDKQHKIEANFAKNGIMILLGARLTPGIRTPVFLMAGVLRMPVQRFLLADALYAVPGVNLLFWLAYLFTDQFVAAVTAVEKHRPLVLVAVLAAVGGVVLYKLLVGRTLSTGAVEEIPAVVKPVGVVTQAVEQAIEKTVGKTVETAAKVVDKVIHPHGHPAAPHGPAPSADGRGSAVPDRVRSGTPTE
ncbi:MAG: DedA family protein [Gemmataceae bacterium]